MDSETLSFLSDLPGARYAVDIVGAVLLLVVGWIAAGWIKRAVRRALDRIERLDPTLAPLIASTARYATLIFVAVAVVAQFGIQTTSILAALGAAGLAIGLALQGTLSNVAAGVMLLVLRPFKVGDYIDAEGLAGTVDEIGLFTTKMRGSDGIYREVPNNQIWNRSIANYSRLPTRRVALTVGIGYGDDMDGALGALTRLMDGDGRVLAEPASSVRVTDLGDSAVTITLHCWATTGDYWDLRCDLVKEIKLALDRQGISIPYPQTDVHLFLADGEADAA